MFHSGEIRWFFRGELQLEIAEWFDERGHGTTEPSRVDNYLILPHCRTASIKLRGGRIEFKTQTGPAEVASYDNGVAGYRDTWVKWSSKACDPDSLNELFVQEKDRWLSVKKQRHISLISLAAEEPVEVPPGSDLLSRGCQVELTSVRIWPRDEDEDHAVPWWSLSFEAFSDPETVLQDLDRAIEHFFDRPPPSPLNLDSSMSYPVLLNTFCH